MEGGNRRNKGKQPGRPMRTLWGMYIHLEIRRWKWHSSSALENPLVEICCPWTELVKRLKNGKYNEGMAADAARNARLWDEGMAAYTAANARLERGGGRGRAKREL